MEKSFFLHNIHQLDFSTMGEEKIAHDGLWDLAIATSKDLLTRLAIEHCVHEARGLDVLPTTITDDNEVRGLDVLPTTITCFRNGGDSETANLRERVIYPEEITHCAVGVKWFKYLCMRSKNPALF